jgi:hypothetical protein
VVESENRDTEGEIAKSGDDASDGELAEAPLRPSPPLGAARLRWAPIRRKIDGAGAKTQRRDLSDRARPSVHLDATFLTHLKAVFERGGQ